MADITKFTRLLNGVLRTVDMSTNTIVVSSIKVGAGQTELTQTILDKLVTMQGVARADGKYDANNIVVAATPTNYTAGAADVEAHLAGIDSAIATAGSTVFSDAVFRVQDNTDSTKQIAFEASAIAASTVRTITVPDSDVDLADIAINTAHVAGDGSDHQDVADLASLSGVAANSTDLGSFTGTVIPDTRTIKQALQDLETYSESSRSLIQNFEWQGSALDYVIDNTAAPATEVSGDRYILSHDGGGPNAAYDGALAGDIVEFNGSIWVATTPTLGSFVSVDDEPSLLYYWGGSSWSTKSFEATTASTGLTKVGFDIRVADANTGGINIASGVITANVDAVTIEKGAAAGNPLQLADWAVTNVKVHGAAGIVESKLSLDFSTSSLNTAIGGKQAASANLDEADTFFGSTDITAAEAETLSDGSNADGLHSHSQIIKSMVAGEAFAANTTFLVRMALNGETAGRIYKADNNATSTDAFYVIGTVVPSGAVSASGSIEVKLLGEHTLGVSDTAFNAADIGKPVYLGSTGGFTVTAPSAVNTAVYKVGVVQQTSKILVNNMQLNGIN